VGNTSFVSKPKFLIPLGLCSVKRSLPLHRATMSGLSSCRASWQRCGLLARCCSWRIPSPPPQSLLVIHLRWSSSTSGAADSTGLVSSSSTSSLLEEPSWGITHVAPDAERLPVLPHPMVPPAPLEQRMQVPRSALQKAADRYTLSGQLSRIQRGETLFQAAKQQSSDP
jgi:hypothetical protein